MDFAIALPTPADSWKVVRRAEELGFSSAWFYDSQLLCADVFVGMAAAAVQTTRIRLGTGVIIPSNRIAPVVANALASLNQLAPGRIDFGIGTGFTGRRTMGLRAIKLADMAEYIRIVRGLLAEDTVSWCFEQKERKIRFLNPELGLINTNDMIPLHVSALGPKSRRLTAELGGNWINFYMDANSAVESLKDMKAAYREIGRDTKDMYSTVFALGCVLAEGESADSPRAKEQAGPFLGAYLHGALENGISPDQMPPDLQDALASLREAYENYEPEDARYLTLHRGHLMFLRPEEVPLMTDEMIRRRTITGTNREVREQIGRLQDAGYDQIAVQIVPGHEAALEDWADVAEGL